MLHSVHYLVTNFVCLLFGAGKVAYYGQLATVSENDAAESGETEPKQWMLLVLNQNNELKDAKTPLALNHVIIMSGFVNKQTLSFYM